MVAPLFPFTPPQVAPEPKKLTLALATRPFRFTTEGEKVQPANAGPTEYEPGTTLKLKAPVASVVRVAESGIDSRRGVEAARDAGADAVLIGTALMRDPALLTELSGVPRA